MEVQQITHWPLYINAGMSVCAFILTVRLIPRFYDLFIAADMYGKDMSKKIPKGQEPKKVPEGLGVITGAVFLIVMFLFIPVPFWRMWKSDTREDFPHDRFVEFIAALLSICCMIFLGFADDVLDLRWRHKLQLPTMATLPLLMVYVVNYGSTTIMVPKPLNAYIGNDINLGVLYYIYMGMLAVFCTNAINILAGVNGLECGQSAVICISVIIFNIVQLSGNWSEAHLFSLYFMMPFCAVCLALLYHNWYPSRAFVGDTFCYFAGMTFAVVAILGHFSKTMLLFFIPQVINFVFSVPQLFHFVPCPRHRLPKFNPDTDTLGMSYTRFKMKNLGFIGRLAVRVCGLVGVIHIKEGVGEDKEETECSNFTILNLVLKITGPMHERNLVLVMLFIQVLGSCVAFIVRFYLAGFFYDVIVY